MTRRFCFVLCCVLLFSCKKSDPAPGLQVVSVEVGTQMLSLVSAANFNVPIDQTFVINFSSAIDTTTASGAISLLATGVNVNFKISSSTDFTSLIVIPKTTLKYNQICKLTIDASLKGKNGQACQPVAIPFNTLTLSLSLISVKVNGTDVTSQNSILNVPLNPSFEFNFASAIDPTSITPSSTSITEKTSIPVSTILSNGNKTLTVSPTSTLVHADKFTFTILNSIKGLDGEVFNGFSSSFYTLIDATPKFPIISDDALLDLVQQQTLKYFYDFGHPVSGLARERNFSGDVVTIGGSGFGLMAMIAGVERGFISRSDGITRFNKIISFLETADRFHGAWPHWINGNTGKVVPFGANDDGADIVETSYMIQGLIALRQYLNSSDTIGNNLINRITTLYQNVEWDWFRKSTNENVLYWNWSPNSGFAVNVPVRGYNETLITYLLAAASTTHTIPLEVYQQGWAQSGNIKNGKTFYGHVLPLGQDYGGPLFFTQYSFLGFNPHVKDSYLNVNYWDQNVNQSLINHDFCAANPHKYIAYSDSCWGLTASDIPSGYGAQSPTNDNGTISPTAALSSFPYTPSESMKALKFFYYSLGDKLWGQYGFYDAINLTQGWTASSTLAIDQGPIVVMIENYRTQLLWNLFMSAPEVQAAKTKLGFN